MQIQLFEGVTVMFNIIEILGGFWFFILHVMGSGSFPRPLSSKDEEKYLKLWHECNDINARNMLVEHNLRLVAHIIKKYYALTSDRDDLVSIGTIGLIKAINTFKPEKSTRLSSYASRCIENEILMYFRNLKKTSGDISLSEAIDTDKDGNPLTLIDIIASDENISESLELKLDSEALKKYVISELTPRERRIMILRYGLNNEKPLTQREVADILKISRSYVSRIEKRALEKLKARFEKN